ALYVAVVVNLDAPGRMRQPEGVGKRREQPLLRRRLGELAAERLAGIGERMLDQILLLAALRHHDLDPPAALDAERFADQGAIGDVVREEDEARARLVVVELGDEGAEHVLGAERAV